MQTDAAALDDLGRLENAKELAQVGAHIPAIFSAAISHAAQHSVGETIISSWLVCEAILTHVWSTYTSSLEKARKRRLEDFRVYSSAVQLETLFTAGLISESIYSDFHAARKIRNELAHNTKMSLNGAAQAVQALFSALRLLNVDTRLLPGFGFMGGGIGLPENTLEPVFDFR
ncbi:hypothetical protein ACFQX7_08990 [Luedemannella flava]